MVRVVSAIVSAISMGFNGATVEASTFLRAGVTSGEAENSLNMELHHKNTERLTEFMNLLRPTFTALPKNAYGLLDEKGAKYALHRMFFARHHWNMKGLGRFSEGDDWVPGYMLESLEQRFDGLGFDLSSLSTIAAALEDLTVQEAYDRLAAVAKVRDIPSEGISREQLETELTTYLVLYLVGGNFTFDSLSDVNLKEMVFGQQFAGWETHKTWLYELIGEMLGDSAVDSTYDQSVTKQVAVEVGTKFGTFNDLECKELKNQLVELSPRSRKAGRVRLADFYKIGLHTHWFLNEKVEYLNALGALDLSNISNPVVIIPNYLVSQSNCMSASELYAVCCPNECEDILMRLEASVAAPSARPARIVQLVEGISTQTVVAPRKLLQSQIDRLSEIAETSSSKEVNLHGRLFAQWLHHAFPNECVFPHDTHVAPPAETEDHRSSEAELRQFVDADVCNGEEASVAEFNDLPWSKQEESFASGPPDDEVELAELETGLMMTVLVPVFLIFVLVWLVSNVKVPASGRRLTQELSRRGKLAAVLVISIIAFSVGLLDTKMFLLGGAVVFLALVQTARQKRAKAESELCL